MSSGQSPLAEEGKLQWHHFVQLSEVVDAGATEAHDGDCPIRQQLGQHIEKVTDVVEGDWNEPPNADDWKAPMLDHRPPYCCCWEQGQENLELGLGLRQMKRGRDLQRTKQTKDDDANEEKKRDTRC